MLLHGGRSNMGEADARDKAEVGSAMAVAASSAIAMILAACAGETADTTTAASTGTSLPKPPLQAPKPRATHADRNHRPCHRIPPRRPGGEAYQVALIYPGTADDLSWSNAWWDGAAQAMEANPNISVESVELLNDPAAVVQQGSAFASEGFDLILIAHGAMVEPAHTIAEQFPDVHRLPAVQPRRRRRVGAQSVLLSTLRSTTPTSWPVRWLRWSLRAGTSPRSTVSRSRP